MMFLGLIGLVVYSIILIGMVIGIIVLLGD